MNLVRAENFSPTEILANAGKTLDENSPASIQRDPC